MDRDGLLRLFNLTLVRKATGQISFITGQKLRMRQKYIIFRIDDEANYRWAVATSGIKNRTLHQVADVGFYFRASDDRYEVIDKSQSTFDASINYPNVQWTPESSIIIDHPRLRARNVYLEGVEYSAYTALFHVLRSDNYSSAEKDTLWRQLLQENIATPNPGGYYSELFDAMLSVKMRCPPLFISDDDSWTSHVFSAFFVDKTYGAVQWLDDFEKVQSSQMRPSKKSQFANNEKKQAVVHAVEREVIAQACFAEYARILKNAKTPNPTYDGISILRKRADNTFFNTLVGFFHQGDEDAIDFNDYRKAVGSILDKMRALATPGAAAEEMIAETIPMDAAFAADDEVGLLAMVAWQLNGWPAEQQSVFDRYTDEQRAAIASAFKGAVAAAVDSGAPAMAGAPLLQQVATWKNVFIYDPRNKREYAPSAPSSPSNKRPPAQYLVLYHQRGKVLGDGKSSPLSYYVPELLYRKSME